MWQLSLEKRWSNTSRARFSGHSENHFNESFPNRLIFPSTDDQQRCLMRNTEIIADESGGYRDCRWQLYIYALIAAHYVLPRSLFPPFFAAPPVDIVN